MADFADDEGALPFGESAGAAFAMLPGAQCVPPHRQPAPQIGSALDSGGTGDALAGGFALAVFGSPAVGAFVSSGPPHATTMAASAAKAPKKALRWPGMGATLLEEAPGSEATKTDFAVFFPDRAPSSISAP